MTGFSSKQIGLKLFLNSVNVGYKDSTPCKCGGWAPHPVKWWNMVGIWLEYGWNIVGILLEYCWKIVGKWSEIVGIWMEYGWNMVF